MNALNTQYLGWLLRRFAKAAGLWGILAIVIAVAAVITFSTKRADIQQQINALETNIATKQLPTSENSAIETPLVQQASSQTISEFYQTFPTALSIPDTLSQLNALATKQQLLLNSGDYKLNKIAAKNNAGTRVLTQYEMVLPVEGSYNKVRAFISSILSNLPSVAIADIQIERESTLSPSVDARLVLILYVRGDQV
jgi:hypothetical protein